MTDETIIPGPALDAIADALWSRLVGAHVSTTELSLRAKLALEQRLYGGEQRPPFGLDKLTGGESADYLGVAVETLHDRAKRRTLKLPQPFHIGRKLFWRLLRTRRMDRGAARAIRPV